MMLSTDSGLTEILKKNLLICHQIILVVNLPHKIKGMYPTVTLNEWYFSGCYLLFIINQCTVVIQGLDNPKIKAPSIISHPDDIPIP